MLSFSPLIVLIPFVLITAVIGFFYIINVTHLVRTGNTSLVSFLFTLFFLAYGCGIILLTYNVSAGYDWQSLITIDLSSFSFTSNPIAY
ncbi:MAG: hypothetical protein AAB467_02370 [Patescibacteria group bacterium]